jgi:hypothetical protein
MSKKIIMVKYEFLFPTPYNRLWGWHCGEEYVGFHIHSAAHLYGVMFAKTLLLRELIFFMTLKDKEGPIAISL